MSAFFAGLALLPGGWARNVRLDVDPSGVLSAVSPAASEAGALRLAGPVLPGVCDLHSHAFQRAMAGLTERGSATADSFWTWREVMYCFAAASAGPRRRHRGAALYRAAEDGYTSVGEFHYVHHDPDGSRSRIPPRCRNACPRRIATGIAFTLLPALYHRPTSAARRRSTGSGALPRPDSFLELFRTLRDIAGRCGRPDRHRAALAARRPPEALLEAFAVSMRSTPLRRSTCTSPSR